LVDAKPHGTGPGPRLARTLGLAAGCFALSVVSIVFIRLPDQVATLWLTNALAAGLLFRWAFDAMASRLATVMLAVAAADLVTGGNPTAAAVFAVANGVEIAVAIALLRLLGLVYDGMPGIGRFLKALLIIGVAAPVAGALAASTAGALLGLDAGLRIAVSWWFASMIGAVAILPMVLTFRTALVGQPTRLRDCARPEFLGTIALAIATTLIALRLTPFPFVLMALPIVLAAGRLGACRTSAVIVVTVATYVVHAITRPGPAPDLEAALTNYASMALVMLPPFLFALQREAFIHAEHSARANATLFRRAMNDSAIGMAIVDLDGTFREVNQALGRMLLHDADALVGMNFRDITLHADRARGAEDVKALLDHKATSATFEKRYVRKDGKAIWCLLAISLIRDEDTHEALQFVTQVEDINTRKLAEEAIAEAENRWRFALHSAGQAVWELDLRTGTVYRSPDWYTMLGYQPGDVADGPDDFLELVHPHDRETLVAADRAMLTGEAELSEVEVRFRHKAGHWIWVLDRGRVAEHDAYGQPVVIIGTHTDITRRRAREEELRVAKERIDLAVQAGEVGIWELDLDTDRLVWDERMYALYQIGPDDFDNTRPHWRTFVHPEDLPEVIASFRKGIEETGRVELDFRIRRGDGEVRYIRALAQVVEGDDGRRNRVIGTQWDTSDQRLLTEELFEEKERLRITLHSIGDAVITTDADMKVTFMNPVAERLSEWPLKDALGVDLADVFRIFDDETDAPIASPVEACLTNLEPFYLQDGAVLVTRTGDRIHIQDSAAPVRAPSGEIIGAVLVFQDVTRTRALQRELAHAALHDSLTGLPNRLSFERNLSTLCGQSHATTHRHALCFIDLDRFKIVNDTAGHAAGDALLGEIARLLRTAVRSQDTIARIGGDEFALLMPETSLDAAHEVAERIVSTIRSFPFQWEGRLYDIGASVGLTEINGVRRDPIEVMKEADVACYAAKANGRGQIAVYRPGASEAERYHAELTVAANLRAAIEARRLILHGQPIVDLNEDPADATTHVEILVRMHDETGKLMAPGQFIPAAERYGLMNGIDRWVVTEVLQTHAEALRRRPDLTISINLSANSLDDPLMWPFVREQLDRSGIAPERIWFEITETALVNNLVAATEFANSAQAYGCRISLDDFGVGLSSFSYLKHFRVNELKIDGSFIRHIADDPADLQIVRAIVSIAKVLGIETVAEWVEDARIREMVRELGIDRAQGYFIGEPRPLESFCRQTGAATQSSRP